MLVLRIFRKIWLTVIFSSLLLLLAACSVGGISVGSSTTPTPTAKSVPAKPSPTSVVPVIPSPAANGSMVTYTGNGYTIDYPKGWTVNKASTDAVTFSDPSGVAYMTIEVVPDPEGMVSTSAEVNASLQIFKSQVKNYAKTGIAPTTSVAGETWSQEAATGNLTPKGTTSPVLVKYVTISDNHPANTTSTQGFNIGYATVSQVFDLVNTAYFQPMLQSFKFTS